MRPGRHLGRADRAEQQRVEAAPLVDDLVGQHRAVAQVAGAAEVVVDGVELDAGGAHDLQGLGDDLGTDAVAADDADCGAWSWWLDRRRSAWRHVCSCPRTEKTAHRGGRSTSARRGGSVRYGMMATEVVGGGRSTATSVVAVRPVVNLIPPAVPARLCDRYHGPCPTSSTSPRTPTTGCRPSTSSSRPHGRIDIARKIQAARELGDLSENGDYHAAKEEQGKMEGRIRHLDALLKNAEIVEVGRHRRRCRPGRSSRSATRATTSPSAT